MLRPIVRIALLVALVVPPHAQAQSTGSKAAPPAGKKGADPEVAGYRTIKLQGFTLLVSNKVYSIDTAKYKTKPLDVLDGELKRITEVMNARSVALLRKLVIWVEWDDREAVGNGRKGTAVAIYNGGRPASLVAEGEHPLRAKTITVLSLRSLTGEHQPDRDLGRCVLLHEFSHAVHDQLLGFDNPRIKAAYQQAMERKLYDKAHYVSTNPEEFFAELTCSYLDKLHYFPNTRDDLKKHDPVSFKVIESLWKASARPVAAVKGGPTNGSDKFDLSITFPKGIVFGPPLAGPKVEPELYAGKVVLVAYWGGEQANVLSRVGPLADELAPYGFVVVAPNPYRVSPEDVAREVKDRGAKYAVVQSGFIRDADPPRNPEGGHAVLFDTEGKCLYRGSAFQVEAFARTAVSRALLAKVGDDEELGAAFAATLKAADAGQGPLALIPKAQALSTNPDADTAAKGKQLLDLLLAPGLEAVAAAKERAKDDPYDAYITAERFAATYKGSAVAPKAQEVVNSLARNKVVIAELRPRPALERFKKQAAVIAAQPGGFNPRDPKFRDRNAQAIAQIKTAHDLLVKQNPDTRAAKEAGSILKEFTGTGSD